MATVTGMGGPRDPSGTRRTSRVRDAAGLIWLGGLVWLTLTPAGGPVSRIVSVCLFCGDRGAADALLNVVLFVPFGLLAGARLGATFALGAGLALSAGVEAGQLFLAGRYTNVGDLVWNGLGAYVGGLSGPVLRARLEGVYGWLAPAAAVALPTLWVVAAGGLLHPTPVDTHASLGAPASPAVSSTRAVAHEPEARGQAPSTLRPGFASLELREGGGWSVTAEALRTPPDPGPSVIVAIHDAAGRPIRALGHDRRDLVLWERAPAEKLGFDRANHRLPRGFAGHEPGTPLTMSASDGREDGVCLRVDARELCGLGVSPARTWTLLRAREHGSARLKAVVDVAWMATLTALVGLLGGSARATLAWAGGFMLVLLAVPHATVLVAAGWAELAGVAVGVGVGVLSRPIVHSMLVPSGP